MNACCCSLAGTHYCETCPNGPMRTPPVEIKIPGLYEAMNSERVRVLELEAEVARLTAELEAEKMVRVDLMHAKEIIRQLQEDCKSWEECAHHNSQQTQEARDEIEYMKEHTWCAYCGYEVHIDDAAATKISEHIATCEKHPRRKIEQERDAARAEAARLLDGMELAWGIIANVSGGNWDLQTPEWKEAAERWRDEQWHKALDRRRAALEGKP